MEVEVWGMKKIKKEEGSIKDLFVKCYGEQIRNKKFDQLYKKNPFGEPRAIALKKNDRLAGFYGLIPQKLSKRLSEKKISKEYLLGVSLMVSPEFRGVNTLSKILKKVDGHLENTNYINVFGFPNEKSFIPLTTLFGWSIVEEAKFYTCQVRNESQNVKIKDVKEGSIIAENEWCVPYGDKRFIEWKEICNSYKTVEIDNDLRVIYKKYKNKIDVLDMNKIKSVNITRKRLEGLAEREKVNGFIMTDYHSEEVGISLECCGEWGNGKIRLCSLEDEVESRSIHLSLLMSDVF